MKGRLYDASNNLIAETAFTNVTNTAVYPHLFTGPFTPPKTVAPSNQVESFDHVLEMEFGPV